ncbi:hypothetical protein SCT_1584 [Sulfuricella sp. T08]|uniref:hypothetical protein n=1 Tax=Sulfuricella sp. T08 TaxID=1632857 RepID=UPI0006179C24|nr:hypothetical protein [Sulfuricella sp. T08]GAO36182.1 hypothetical protein SCT_1584 [Sulfuricella sp. T08]
MKIESSNLLLSSQHSSIDKHTAKESLRMWVGDQRPDFEGRSRQRQNPAPAADSVRLSAEALAAAHADTTKQVAAVDPEKDLENDPRYQLIILMVEALTGKKIKLTKLEDVQPAVEPANIPDPNKAASQQQQQTRPAGFGIEYDRHETLYEAEQTSFSAQGVVKTADGKEISFDLQLSMSREHYEESNVSLRLGDAKKKDPLVINFGGTAAQLTSTKFNFDLNADGSADQISFVAPGSGFLALDKNADGKINNGSELFGPASGNGFSELAAYDQDKNGWIDENDAVYQKLQIWTKDAGGKDTLSNLAQKNVGAIYLGNISTPFDIKNGQNQLDGQVKSSGVYLSEDGGAGTVQQIDLAV